MVELLTLGKYQLLRRIATGGMAEIFLAKTVGPMGFEKILVVKRILPHFAQDPEFVRMFLKEAKLAAQLNHSHLVQIFDFGESGGAYFIAMERVDGVNLRDVVLAAQTDGWFLPFTVCAKLVSLVCDALEYVHRFADPQTGQPLGLVHRDVSPDNILLSRDGNVKLVDFGIAKASTAGTKTVAGTLKGKAPYMSPEQIEALPVDRRSDVYALGVTLHYLVARVPPFWNENSPELLASVLTVPPPRMSEKRPDVPARLQAIVDRALEKKADDRYPTAHAMQEDLEAFIQASGEPTGARQLAEIFEKVPVPEVVKDGGKGNATAPLRDEAVAVVRTRTAPGDSVAKPARRRWPIITAAAAATVAVIVAIAVGRTRAPVPAPISVVASQPPPVALAPVVPPATTPEPTQTPKRQPPAPPHVAIKPISRHAKSPRPEKSPAPGTLEFRVRPWGTVFLDGKKMGQTPLPPVQLAEGVHHVRVVGEDKREHAEDVRVKSGQGQVFKYSFEQ